MTGTLISVGDDWRLLSIACPGDRNQRQSIRSDLQMEFIVGRTRVKPTKPIRRFYRVFHLRKLGEIAIEPKLVASNF